MKSLILPPLSVLYGAVTRTRVALYRRGTFHSTSLDRPVISVGNITTGGTGKTPLVEYVARILSAQGKRVCILTRGYGRDNPKQLVVVSDGHTVLATPDEGGDEPFLLATNLLGSAAVISNADRVAASQEASKQFGVDCFVLDDGFQHLRVRRDLNILAIDATNPWGGGHLLPYGRLREPRAGVRRADCIVITRCDQANNLAALREEITRLNSVAGVFESRMRIVHVVPLRSFETDRPPKSPLAAFCAVGNPRAFFNQIPDEVVLEKAFPDHHRYSQAEIDAVVDEARRAGANSLITTAKDAVKLQSISFSLPCYVLEITPQIDNEAALTELILNSVKA